MQTHSSYLEYVGFESPQHVRSQHLMQPLDLLLLGNVRKLVLEDGEVVELLRSEEVEQVEQFFQVILQRGSG